MRITHIISNKTWGGGEQYVLDLCSHLIADGYEVNILARATDAVTKRLAVLNVTIAELSFAHLLAMDTDVVHVHNFKDARKVALARLLSGKKYRIVVTRHLIRPAKTGWIDNWLYRQIDRLIFVSQLACDTFYSTSPKISKEKTVVILNSIVTPASGRVVTLQHHGEDIIMMYHGRITEEKGLDTLIHALSLLPDINYHIYLLGTGTEKYTEYLHELVNKHDIAARVSFLGFKENVMDYITNAHIGIIPTIAQEACGLSCMEYMSAGKCVITTNNGGQREYIESGRNGMLVPPNDAEALAKAIRDVVKDKEYERIGLQAAVDFNNQLSYSSFYQNIKNNYEVTGGPLAT